MKPLQNKTIQISIKITDIKVKDGYFYIFYEYNINGKNKKGKYDSDYEGYTEKEFKKVLEKGYAFSLALEEINSHLDL